MLVIRFSRVGRHNHAQYRIVVQEKAKAPTGKHVAIVGSYDPHSKETVLKESLIKEYLANGAQPSDSVYNLFVTKGIIDGDKRVVKIPEKKEEAAEETKEAVEEKPEAEKAEDKEEKKEEVLEEAEEAKEEEKSEATGEEKPEAEKAEDKKEEKE